MRRNIKCEGPAQRGKLSEKVFQSRYPLLSYRVLSILNNQVSSSSPPPPSELSTQQDGGASSLPSKSKQPPQPPQNSILDEMEDEKAFANVLPDATRLLWSKLLERRGYQITDGEVVLSPSKADPPPAGRSTVSSFRRANSFAPVVQAKDRSASRQLPFGRSSSSVTSAGSVASSSKAAGVRPLEKQPTITEIVEEPEAGPSRSGPAPSTTASMIFAGMVFRALGEAKCPNVRHAISGLGGRMSTDQDEDVDFIIVRLVR